MVYYLIKPEEYFNVKPAKYSALRFFIFPASSALKKINREVLNEVKESDVVRSSPGVCRCPHVFRCFI